MRTSRKWFLTSFAFMGCVGLGRILVPGSVSRRAGSREERADEHSDRRQIGPYSDVLHGYSPVCD